jgi:hypothetical protein
MHLHFAERVVAQIFTDRVSNLKSVRWLALLLPIANALPAPAQYQDRYGQQPPRICRVQGGQFVCAPAPVPDPYGLPPAPTLESLVRERAEMQNRQRSEPLEQAAFQRHNTEPIAKPDAPDQSELLKNSKDADFIRRHFRTMYVETRGIDLFGPELISAELKKNEDFNKMHIEIVQDRKVADTVLSVSYNFAWDYPFVLRHQNTTTVLLGGKGEGPFSGPLGAWDVARQFVNAARKWRLEPEPNASPEPKPSAETRAQLDEKK